MTNARGWCDIHKDYDACSQIRRDLDARDGATALDAAMIAHYLRTQGRDAMAIEVESLAAQVKELKKR